MCTTVKIHVLKAWQQYTPQIHRPLMSWQKISFSHALLARDKFPLSLHWQQLVPFSTVWAQAFTHSKLKEIY